MDDNGLLLMKYERAMALAEASWTQTGHVPGTTQIGGEEGILVADYHAGDLILYDDRNKRRQDIESSATGGGPTERAGIFSSQGSLRRAHRGAV